MGAAPLSGTWAAVGTGGLEGGPGALGDGGSMCVCGGGNAKAALELAALEVGKWLLWSSALKMCWDSRPAARVGMARGHEWVAGRGCFPLWLSREARCARSYSHTRLDRGLGLPVD